MSSRTVPIRASGFQDRPCRSIHSGCERSRGFFVFEGPDGVGKSALVIGVAKVLAGQGIASKTVAFPGQEPGTLGAHIHALHHDPTRFGIDRLSATSLQLLHVAAHLDAIDSQIRPSIEAGDVVLLDRYWWSTWVYGIRYGVPRDTLQAIVELERQYWQVNPTAIFLIRRASPISNNESDASFRALTVAYESHADRESADNAVHFIENNGTLSATIDVIVHAIRDHMEQEEPSTIQARAIREHRGMFLESGVAWNEDRPKDYSSAQLEIGKGLAGSPQGPSSSDSGPPRSTGVKQIDIHMRLAPAKPTVVYDTYWRFAAERQDVFYRRFAGKAGPWTADPILARYKFTNTYRASDRVSQYLIRKVIYQGDQTPAEVFFRTLLFKIFNRIDTWERLVGALSDVRWKTYRYDRYDRILSDALKARAPIYSAAYIMPSGGARMGGLRKHQMHLRLLERMLVDRLPDKIAGANSMRHAFELMRAYPTIGDFLAYQYVTDLNYSDLTSFSETEFVVPGPGALDGIRKCFATLGGLNEAEVIRLVTDRQAQEFDRLGLSFRSLWGRPLQYIDCQSLFCEVDKYARVRHPEAAGRTGRTRIKQHFRPDHTPLPYWYPPKWGINDQITRHLARHEGSPPDDRSADRCTL